MPVRFLDTNILIRHFTRDDEQKAEAALALLTRVEDGTEKAVTSSLVMFEVVFLLERTYAVPKAEVAAAVLSIVRLRGLKLERKTLWSKALRLYAERNLDFADAYNAVYMQSLGVDEIYSWDEDFDSIPGIARRLEPSRSQDRNAA